MKKKLFDGIPRIEGERLVIDALTEADAPALQELMDNSKAYRFEPSFLFERRFDDARTAIAEVYGPLFANKESLILAIRTKVALDLDARDPVGEMCGLAEFYGLRDDAHKISVGARFLERYWGYGLATEATRMLVDYLFNETDIELITASTSVGNSASAHVLEKVGFIRTARGVEEDWGFDEPMLVDKWFY